MKSNQIRILEYFLTILFQTRKINAKIIQILLQTALILENQFFKFLLFFINIQNSNGLWIIKQSLGKISIFEPILIRRTALNLHFLILVNFTNNTFSIINIINIALKFEKILKPLNNVQRPFSNNRYS